MWNTGNAGWSVKLTVAHFHRVTKLRMRGASRSQPNKMAVMYGDEMQQKFEMAGTDSKLLGDCWASFSPWNAHITIQPSFRPVLRAASLVVKSRATSCFTSGSRANRHKPNAFRIFGCCLLTGQPFGVNTAHYPDQDHCIGVYFKTGAFWAAHRVWLENWVGSHKTSKRAASSTCLL
jgi:hypothetical protein